MTPLLLLLPPQGHVFASRFLADAPVDPTTGFLTYGPLGLMVAGFLTGVIVPGPTHKRVVEENQRLRELMDNKVYPTVESSTAATREANALIKELMRLLPPAEDPPRRRAR